MGRKQAWALDPNGLVYLSSDPELVVWNRLVDEGQDKPESQHQQPFEELACSADGRVVWSLDRAGCVYARVAIYPDVPSGTGWDNVELVSTSRPVQIAASR
jgi:hypothetical protein